MEQTLYSKVLIANLSFDEAWKMHRQGHRIARAIWGGYWEARNVEPFGLITVAVLKDGGYAPAMAYPGDMWADDWMVVEVDEQ